MSTLSALNLLTEKVPKGNPDRATFEEIVSGKREATNSTDEGEVETVITHYIYDILQTYYNVLTETTNGDLTQYEYGLERVVAYTATTAEMVKTQYAYDVRGSVIQTVSSKVSMHIAEATAAPMATLPLPTAAMPTATGIIPTVETQSYAYTPFGEQIGNAVSGYTYNGEAYDAATGMLNLRARQYEPAQMRFSQQDIVRGYAFNPQTANRYVYCINNPISYADPSGELFGSLLNRIKEVGSKIVSTVKKAVNTVKQAVNIAYAKRFNSNALQYDSLSDKDKAVMNEAAREYEQLNRTTKEGTPEYYREMNRIIRAACSKLGNEDAANTDIIPTPTPSITATPTPTPSVEPGPTRPPYSIQVVDLGKKATDYNSSNSFIIYSTRPGSEYSGQAKYQQKVIEASGGSAYLLPVGGLDDFKSAWSTVAESERNIDVVSIIVHSNGKALLIENGTSNEAIGITGKNSKNESIGRISDLEDIEMNKLNLYSCNTANLDLAQTSNGTIAEAFLKKEGIHEVMGYDGSVSYGIPGPVGSIITSINGNYYPRIASSQRVFNEIIKNYGLEIRDPVGEVTICD